MASVLAKVKIPLGHSAAALMRLANMDYSGMPLRLASHRTFTLELTCHPQAQTPCSSACSWTRSTHCRTRSSTRSSSTSSASPTRTRRAEPATRRSCPSSGTSPSSSSARGTSESFPCLRLLSMLVLIVCVCRYASDLTPDQKDALLDVIRVNPHPQISPEVRRELVNSVERGAPRPDADGDISMA